MLEDFPSPLLNLLDVELEPMPILFKETINSGVIKVKYMFEYGSGGWFNLPDGTRVGGVELLFFDEEGNLIESEFERCRIDNKTNQVYKENNEDGAKDQFLRDCLQSMLKIIDCGPAESGIIFITDTDTKLQGFREEISKLGNPPGAMSWLNEMANNFSQEEILKLLN